MEMTESGELKRASRVRRDKAQGEEWFGNHQKKGERTFPAVETGYTGTRVWQLLPFLEP